MVQSDRKSDEHGKPFAPGYKVTSRRSETSDSLPTIMTATNATADRQDYYRSARHWQSQRTTDSFSRSWKSEKKSWNDADDGNTCANICDIENERSCPAVTARLPRSKPFRRMLLLLLGVLALGYFCWRQAVGPLIGADWHVKEGFVRSYRGTHGHAMGGDYDIEQNRVVDLDASLIPGGVADPEGKRRLVFVGDIHGCKTELDALLKACAFNAETDHLIATGDVISKGPDSPGVVDELIRLNATSVRGNHEDRILTMANVKIDPAKNGPKDMTADSSKDAKLLKSLHQRHIDYVKNMPLILRIPALPLAHASSKGKHHKDDHISTEILVVHAGLVPAVPLRKQDSYSVMNMRSLARRTHVPSSLPSSKQDDTLPWFDLWNWYHIRLHKGEVLMDWHESDTENEQQQDHQKTWSGRIFESLRIGPLKRRKHPRAQVVVYGHDSKVGLKIKTWSKGLDTRAVRGGELTAMVLDARGRTDIISVKSNDYTME